MYRILQNLVVAIFAVAIIVPNAHASDVFAASTVHSQSTNIAKESNNIQKNMDVFYGNDTLPLGIRSRFVENINGLTIHILEAGFEEKGRPCILLLHGFPELAYSWRKVMLPLAEEGFYVVAPDQRGYGRTTGWDDNYDGDISPFRLLNVVRDALGLVSALGYKSVAAVVGHDYGSPVAAWCSLTRPDVFRSVVLMSAPFGGTGRLPFNTANKTPQKKVSSRKSIHEELAALPRPRKHYQWYYTTREANDNMRNCRQGIHDFLRGYFHYKSADWKQNKPFRLKSWSAAELAKIPTYYIMDLNKGMAETVASEMPSALKIATCKWLTNEELRVYSTEFARTGFQGGLNWYRCGKDARFRAEFQLFSGLTIDVPSCFIGGASDWGVYQSPGSLERMQKNACTNMLGVHLVEGAGHWVQQEQPEQVTKLLIQFLKQAKTAPTAGLGLEVISQTEPVPLRGVYEIEIKAEEALGNPFFDVSLKVQFTRPDQSKVSVDGFYDGKNLFKARAYCDTLGKWTYLTQSNINSLNDRKGSFVVVPSKLPGKLRIHPEDCRQFAYDSGKWFLHIGDTGYRFVVKTEPRWREYIDEANKAGFTKIRTWFAQSRSKVEALYTPDRKRLDLEYWQEIDRRLHYCLNHYPHIILQLIPYAEDTEELIRYGKGDRLSRFIAQYPQARWSAFPNIYWEISNDREIAQQTDLSKLRGRQISYHVISQIGRDMKAREPWDTLLTNQQNRFAGYSFVNERWSDIITLEDIDQTAGEIILTFRQKGDDPVVLDEDRYENYRNPANPRYFFRRMMWASLLSGGHATYGGLRTYEAYDGGPVRGVQGYYRANRLGVLSQGAHDFLHIHSFFKDTGLTLVGMVPDDELVGGKPLKAKCIHNECVYIIYAANPDGDDPRTDNPRVEKPNVNIKLPQGSYKVKWFNPRQGTWDSETTISVNGTHQLETPAIGRIMYGDWIILIVKNR